MSAGMHISAQKGALIRARNAIHPGQLQREIARLCAELERFVLTKTPAPKRVIHRAFNSSIHPVKLYEATKQRSRRI